MGLGLGVHEIELTDVADILLCRDVDDIHDMMDDIGEQNEIAEISTALSQPISFGAEIDEVRN